MFRSVIHPSIFLKLIIRCVAPMLNLFASRCVDILLTIRIFLGHHVLKIRTVLLNGIGTCIKPCKNPFNHSHIIHRDRSECFLCFFSVACFFWWAGVPFVLFSGWVLFLHGLMSLNVLLNFGPSIWRVLMASYYMLSTLHLPLCVWVCRHHVKWWTPPAWSPSPPPGHGG